jgi:hypothetical protein
MISPEIEDFQLEIYVKADFRTRLDLLMRDLAEGR